MIPVERLLPFFAASWFFLAAAYFWYRLRKLPPSMSRMRSIGVYLFGIGLFFTIRGFDAFAPFSCTVVDCTQLTGGLAVTLAAAFIARFPLQSAWPDYARPVFAGLAVVGVASQVGLAVAAPALQVPVAHGFAFLVAGVFSVGYILYAALREDSTTGKGIGLSMASCCVVAHGLTVLPLVATVSLPLLGVPLGVPYLFAILAPVALIAVLVFFARVDPEAVDESTGETEGEAVST